MLRICSIAILIFTSIQASNCNAWQEIVEVDDRQQLVQGLTSRRLFRLAETTCQRELSSKTLNTYEHAVWTVELIKVRTAVAASATGENRAAKWRSAEEIGRDFVEFFPDHPYLVMVKVQGALSNLARGQLMRQEIEVGMRPASDVSLAIEQLGNAIRKIDDTETSDTADDRLCTGPANRESYVQERIAKLENEFDFSKSAVQYRSGAFVSRFQAFRSTGPVASGQETTCKPLRG